MAQLSNSNPLEAALRRDGLIVVSVLALVVLSCCAYLLSGVGSGPYPQPVWSPSYGGLMFSMWWLMMIAMMLPSATPMILLHARLSRRGTGAGVRAPAQTPLVASVIFTFSYLVVWGGFSGFATGGQWLLGRAGLLSEMMVVTNPYLGAGLLLAAGIWQLTPLKNVCLRHCRSPLHFLSTQWRPGNGGALRMGLHHGIYCLGCCWFLMALLFFGGVMNLVWIIGLALFVLCEKMVPAGVQFARLTGLVLVCWAAWMFLGTVAT